MRLTVIALGSIAFLLTGCVTGGGHPRTRDGAAASYQDISPSVRQFPARQTEPSSASESWDPSATQARYAVLGALDEVRGSTVAMTGLLQRLAGSQSGLTGRVNGVFHRYTLYGSTQLQWDMSRVQQLIEPSMKALSSLEPRQVEAATTALPDLLGQLTAEFDSIHEGVRVAVERTGQFMVAAQVVELLTMASAMKLALPRLPPAAPATLSMGLVMGTDGVLLGTRIVVSTEWVERMRQLVQAGVISLPAVSAAVRVHSGQVLMSQSNQDLPRGVREALGDGPEVRGMHETGKAGAGMAERPQHHVMPREHREWFEKRGFTGDLSIDEFCVELELAHHQAIHGGGNWRLGRTWPQEWNQMIMGVLRDAETAAGRKLTRNQILKLVGKNMRNYDIPMNFSRWRGR